MARIHRSDPTRDPSTRRSQAITSFVLITTDETEHIDAWALHPGLAKIILPRDSLLALTTKRCFARPSWIRPGFRCSSAVRIAR
jgi:hypothetical protein